MANLLAIISKYPTPGNVKTRLGNVIGMEPAADLAKAMLLDLIENHLGQSYELSLETNDIKYLPASKQLFANIPVREASGELLRGPKSILLDVFTYHLKHYQKVIAICADTPMVGKVLIENAFRDLDSYEVVLGSDLGPGYYLIGLSQPHDLFSSLKEAKDKRRPYFEETLDLIRNLNLSYKLVEGRIDVDTLEDLHKVQWFSQEDGEWIRSIRMLSKLNLLSS